MDRDSAFEMLARRVTTPEVESEAELRSKSMPKSGAEAERESESESESESASAKPPPSALEAILASKTTQKIVDNVAKELVRGLFGNRKRR